jgi:hypothetical protein
MGRAGLALAVALAGCHGAAADGAAPRALALAVPAAWSPLAQVARAAQVAAGPGARAQAWGDPAAGCSLIGGAVDGAVDDDAEEASAALRAGLGLPGATGAPLDGPITGAALTGRVRGFVTPRPSGAIVSTAVACVANDRDPTSCARACDGVWAALTSAPEVVAEAAAP